MSVSITVRTTKSGRRFVVRYRLGGRMYPVEHGGSFATMREARARRDLIAGEIANGRNPRVLLGQLGASQKPVRAVGDWAEAYALSRVDAAPRTVQSIRVAAKRFPAWGDPSTVTATMVAEWLAAFTRRETARRYLQVLRQVFEYAGTVPNPARDARVRLPREERVEVEPPSARAVDLIVRHCTNRHRLAVLTLAETGMRVGELVALEWRDVDLDGARFRIRHGKTAAARRWVAIPDDVFTAIAATPDDDRAGRVFPQTSEQAIASAIRRACQAAVIAHYHPHDLRHRYASVMVARGVPPPNVSAALGHSRKSLTLDTYSHVLIDEETA
ncbi:MAG TPA: site-specific integrase [Gaiellales bacterium]|jgi:integrase|nr:site-specific integrase [Gaiellales bacterium]